MNSLRKYIVTIWILFTPVVAGAHEGHGLTGQEHYHVPIDLGVLIALTVVALLVVGLKKFFGRGK